jgi:hypothetical protein
LFLGYRYFFQGRSFHALKLVSSDAIFVFETTEPVLAWNQLVTQPLWARLAELPSVTQAQSQLMTLDSLVGRSGNLDRSLRGNHLTVSLHPVSREEFDFLFTLEFKSRGGEAFIENLEQNLPPMTRVISRSYGNLTLKEVQSPELKRNFTYTRINNVFVGSYTSFLVEEAIRLSQNDPGSNFHDQYQALFKDLPVPQGLGVLRISSQGISKMIETISRDSQLSLVKQLNGRQISANLEFGFAENRIMLNGYSFFAGGSASDFSKNNQNRSNSFAPFISNRTAVFLQYSNSLVAQERVFRNPGFQFISTLKGDVEKQLLQQGFLERINDEIGLMMFETINKESQDMILLIKTEGLQDQLSLLKEFNKGQQTSSDAVASMDFYLDREIFMIPSQDFPAHVFDGRFIGFDDTFITGWQDLLVFANSSKAMKLFLDDLNSDFTWSKSLQQKNYLEAISGAAGLNMVVNIPRLWNSIIEISSPSWKVFFQKYGQQLKSIDQVNVQVADQKGKNEVKIQLVYHLSPFKTTQDVILTENRSVQFREQLIYGPKPIQNFTDRSREFVVQDELNQLYLITSEGETVFSIGLDGKIVSDIFQVDYYQNGKLQLLFATANNLYIIDRFGNILSGYPRRPSNEAIKFLNLVDYSNNKDYRFFLATEYGNLLLLDKNGNLLEGWNPNIINAVPAVEPAHHRIAGIGDHMLTLAKTGELYFFNRRGELLPGSPIRLGEGLSSDYIILERGSAKDTRLVTVTRDGEVVHVNFLGEITFRNQLLRPDRETSFHLVKDQKDDRYLFVVHEYSKISVLNQDLEVLFEKSILSDQLGFQFFSFGTDKNIFAVSDRNQDFIYLYNLKGELLNTKPISGAEGLELLYLAPQNEYVIYVRDGNEFKEYKLPL